MHYETTLTKKLLIRLNPSIYTPEVINEVRCYWNLEGNDDEDILLFVCEHIARQLQNGIAMEHIEGILDNPSAHQIVQEFAEEIDTIPVVFKEDI